MMFYMVSLRFLCYIVKRDTENRAHFKGSRIWNANGKVCKYSQKFIGRDGSEGKIVRDLVDGKEEIMVSGPSDGISTEKE